MTKKDSRFQPGKSGNPAGRPPGITDKRTKFRKLFEDDAADVIRKVVEKAKEGDMTAARMVVERIAPPIKARGNPIHTAIPDGTFEEQAKAIFEGLNNGELSAEELTAMIGAVTQRAKLAEIDELKKRIEALEQQRKITP